MASAVIGAHVALVLIAWQMKLITPRGHEPPRSISVGLDGGAAAVPGDAASGPPGLALTPGRAVMQGSLANPAVNDPRSNSPRPTFEEKVAMGLDPTLCLKWERLPDGTIRRALIHRKEAQSTMSATHGGRTKPVMVCD